MNNPDAAAVGDVSEFKIEFNGDSIDFSIETVS